MSLQNAAVVTAPSAFTPTGGTALTFTLISQSANGVSIAVAADTDSRTRRRIETSLTVPRVSAAAPNGYTQARNELKFKKPKLLANGKFTTNEIIIQLRSDPETTQVEIQELLDVGAQALTDSDFSNFWKLQSLA